MELSEVVKQLAIIARERVVVKNSLISDVMKARLLQQLDAKERALEQSSADPAANAAKK